jgi:fumarate hydratase, class I
MTIKSNHIITAVKHALQHIACYHSNDFIQALHHAYQREQSTAAKDALAQLLINSRLCAEHKRPICQDTGMVVVLADVGVQTQFEGGMTLQDMIDDGVRQAYQEPSNPLRSSMVNPPFGTRQNTRDNTPAMVHIRQVPGNTLRLSLFAKGGGSENKTRFAVLTPDADIEQWVVDTVAGLGAGWCPPGVIGIGIGGSPDQTIGLAKRALLEKVDMEALQQKTDPNEIEALRLRLYERINALGIGAQGLGGVTTVLDVKIHTLPTHAASLPIALVPNCAASRHISIDFDGSGVPSLPKPSLLDWPIVERQIPFARKIDADVLDRNALKNLKAGDTVLLSGKILTARDAAHRKIRDLLARGQNLADYGLDFQNRMLYYVGPVDPIGNEAVGPAGPTTSTRMDGYTAMMLDELGLVAMIGKGERGGATIGLLKKHQAVYFIAVGGAAYLVAQAIKSARVVAFAELGMEAVYEFSVKDMPLTVAVDIHGQSIHSTGPKQWRRDEG